MRAAGPVLSVAASPFPRPVPSSGPAAGGRQRPAPRRRDIRRALLDAAADSFVSRGYTKTSLDDIARRAGVTKGGIYYHFRHKEELLVEVERRAEDLVLKTIEPLSLAPESALRRLDSMVRSHIELTVRQTNYVRLLVRGTGLAQGEGVAHARTLAAGLEDFNTRYERLYTSVIEDGIREGSFRPVDPILAARACVGSLQWLAVWYPVGDVRHEPDMADIPDAFAGFLLAGLMGYLAESVADAPGTGRPAELPFAANLLLPAELRAHEPGPVPADSPSGDLGQLSAEGIEVDVVAHPLDGFELIDADPSRADVVRAVIRGWGRAPVDAALARRIVARLGELDLQENANEIVRMFFMLDTIDAGRLSWLDLPEARALAVAIGDALASAPARPTATIGDAINSPGGRLIEFWVKCLLADEAGGAIVAGRLPEQVSAACTKLLRIAATREAAQIVLAAHAHVLLGLDPGWSARHVVPLFDNRDEATSSRAWRGFLTWGRPVDALLEAGLIDAYVDVAARLPSVSIGNDLQGLLAQHLAFITVGSSLNLSLGWLDQLTTVLSPDRRALWFRAIGHQLRDMAPDAVALTWSIRLSPYWTARVDGRPTALTPPEASAMAAWIPHLGPAASAAIGLTLRSPASLHRGSSLLDDLDERFVGAHGEEVQRLVVHLLRGTDPARYVGTAQVERIVELIEGSAPHLDRRELRTAAARFGVRPN